MHIYEAEKASERLARPGRLDPAAGLAVGGRHCQLPGLHYKDEAIGISDLEEELAGSEPKRLDGRVHLGKQGGVELAEHVEAVKQILEFWRDAAAARLLLLQPVLGRAGGASFSRPRVAPIAPAEQETADQAVA